MDWRGIRPGEDAIPRTASVDPSLGSALARSRDAGSAPRSPRNLVDPCMHRRAIDPRRRGPAESRTTHVECEETVKIWLRSARFPARLELVPRFPVASEPLGVHLPILIIDTAVHPGATHRACSTVAEQSLSRARCWISSRETVTLCDMAWSVASRSRNARPEV